MGPPLSAGKFSSALALYDCAASRQVQYHKVEHPVFERLCEASRRLESAAGDHAHDPLLRPLIRDARRVRLELSTAPLLFNDEAVGRRLQCASYEAIARKVRLVYPAIADAVGEVAGLLRDLLASDVSPLRERVVSLSGRRTALLTKASGLVEAVRASLRTKPATKPVEVMDVESIRSARPYGRLIVCGPAHWFPDYVFSAPRSADIHVVSYRWQSSEWREQHAFFATAGPEPQAIPRVTTRPVSNLAVEDWPTLDWEAISLNALKSGREEAALQGADEVESRLFILSGDLAVYLDCRATVLVIDSEAEDNQRVKRLLPDNIEPGMFLLRRTVGGGDYIVPLANQILGDRAKGHRSLQQHWKEKLREVVAASREPDVSSRLIDVSLRLIELGATRADEQNLRYWMSARNISTRDLPHFRAIMQLVGLGAETERYWAAMRQILAAHHQAGRRVRRRLLERVRGVEAENLQWSGQLDFALPNEEGGKLTAFRVEGRAPTRAHVPATLEGELIERED